VRSALGAVKAAVGLSFAADPWRASGLFAFLSLAAAADVSEAYWLKLIVDAAVRSEESAALLAAFLLGGAAALGVLFGAIGVRLILPVGEQAGHRLDQRVLELTAGIPGLEAHERPEYLDQLQLLRDRRGVLAAAGNEAATALSLAVQLGATGVLLVSVNPLLLGVPLFALPSLWLGWRGERIHQRALDEAAEGMRRARHLFELATSPAPAKELRVFGLGAELVARHRCAWNDVDQTLDRAALRQLLGTAAGWLVFIVGYLGAVAVVVHLALRGSATVGDVVLTLGLMAQINFQVLQSMGSITALMQTVKVGGRYRWLEDYCRAARRTEGDSTPVPGRITRGIELAKVTFRYPGATAAALDDVSLTVPAAATVAIVGENGAGKSTLVKLLCRFYDPTEGTVSVDGIDLRRIDVEAWRSRLTAAFQDAARLEVLAHEAVGVGYLLLMGDAAAIERALRRAAAEDVIAGLPHGLDTPLGANFDGGVELSGGQWQKLALARAMMRSQPLLLVLDEPTAALDAATEHALFERYADAARSVAAETGTITVLVSHRFSTVRMAGLIVVLDGGRVVEVGSHEELMDRRGLYAELFAMQAAAYR
jgi:ATP-binding cassette, subfamily B, bacterial